MTTAGRDSSARRIGAYVLPGDPVWLRSSLARYYHLLDRLVVPVPEDGRGWTGAELPVSEALAAVRAVDRRGLLTTVRGSWVDARQPMVAEISQRQAAVTALSDVDWVLQVDNDEVLPDPGALLGMLDRAEQLNLPAVEWPMRVLFRRLANGRFLEVVSATGEPRYDYPGPIAVRPSVQLVDCRRATAPFLRPMVAGDASSLQVVRPPAENEHREPDALNPDQAILHNSWARRPDEIRRKIASTAHQEGWRLQRYYWWVWRAAPWRWRRMRDFHLFGGNLWPRLQPLAEDIRPLLDPEDWRQ